jgi:hypothetical protein
MHVPGNSGMVTYFACVSGLAQFAHADRSLEQLSRLVDEDRLGGFLFGVFARSFDAR